MASQITIGKKLFGSFGALLALTLVVGGTSIWLISSLGSSLNKMANVTARKEFLASEIDANQNDMLAAERGILLRTLTREAALVAKDNQDFQESATDMKANLDALNPLIETENGRRIFSTVQSQYENALRLHQDFYQLVS